jgi:small subunit ribosomal protein S1
MNSDKSLHDNNHAGNEIQSQALPGSSDSIWTAIQQRHVIGSIVTGVVVRRNAGLSLIKLEDGVLGWLYDSELMWSNEEALSHDRLYLGQSIRLRVYDYAHKKKRLLLSPRQPDPSFDWSPVETRYPIDRVLELPILRRETRGFIIGLDNEVESIGLTGWLPNSETSQLPDGKANYKTIYVGQRKPLIVNGYSRVERRIIFSARRLEPPVVDWSIIIARYSVGTVVEGIITWIGKRGSVVAIGDSAVGWLPERELSWARSDRNSSEFLMIGNSFRLKVIGSTPERKSLTLSLRQIEENPLNRIDDATFVGATYRGVVGNITKFGVFVRLPIGLDGLIHASEIPFDLSLAAGDCVTVLVLALDKQNERIVLRYVGPNV